MSMFKTSDYLVKSITLLNLQIILDFICSRFITGGQIQAIERYFAYTIITYYFLKGIKQNYQRPTFEVVLFLLWIVIVLVQSLPDVLNPYFHYVSFKQFISGKFFVFIIPFLILIDLKIETLREIFKLSFWLLFVYWFFAIILFRDIFISHDFIGQTITIFSSGIGLLLLTYSYQESKTNRIIWITLITVIISMMLIGRRSVAIYYLSLLFFALLLNFFAHSSKRSNIFTLFLIFSLAIFFYIVLFTSTFDFFWGRMSTGMDSREMIIKLFINDFNRTPDDWIYGRGLYGTFYGGILGNEDLNGSRTLIENGYLNLILNGGYIYLVLLILTCVRSIWLGLFASNNILCKGMSCIIIIYFIDMIGYGLPSQNLKYLAIFLSIAGTRSQGLRNMSNDELIDYLSLT